MKRLIYSYKEGLKRGLRPSTKLARNSQALSKLQGMYVDEECVATPEPIDMLNLTSLGCTFPYPQVFVCMNRTVICTPTAIYELESGAAVSKLTGLTQGCLWSCADFGPYIVLTNGKQTVYRNPETSAWSVTTDVPIGTTIAAQNGQILVGSMDATITYPNIDGLGYTKLDARIEGEGSLKGCFAPSGLITGVGTILGEYGGE